MMERRLIAKTIGDLAAAYIVTSHRSSSASIISEAFRGYDNILRTAMGVEPIPRPPGRPPMTVAGARQHLYDINRQRWIETGDLDALELMVRNVQ